MTLSLSSSFTTKVIYLHCLWLYSQPLYTEEFHNTPETQTDESYTHPEDYEHFGHHEAIERKEAEKEAKYQGITVEEVLKVQEETELAAEAAAAKHAKDALAEEQAPMGVGHPHNEQVEVPVPIEDPSRPQVTRQVPPEKQDPSVRFKEAKSAAESKGEWGQGDGGYRAPKEASDKMRKNLPYKVRYVSLVPVILFLLLRWLTRNVCSTNSNATGAISEDPLYV